MKLRSLALNQFKKFTSPARLHGIDDGLNVLVGTPEYSTEQLATKAARTMRASQNEN